MQNILICDDDKEIVEAVSIYLQSEGFNTIKCYDGIEVHSLIAKNNIDLVILDIMMPKENGLKTALKIRSTDKLLPIIFLSSKSDDNDKIIGLNIGADDYITKPFNPLELIARIKTLLRRKNVQDEQNDKNNEIVIDNLVINNSTKTVKLDNTLIKLTPIEYDILYLLASNLGKVFSISDIYEHIWHSDPIDVENTVAVHIRHIREKIEVDAKSPKFIKVIWGIGYKMDKI